MSSEVWIEQVGGDDLGVTMRANGDVEISLYGKHEVMTATISDRYEIKKFIEVLSHSLEIKRLLGDLNE